MKKEIFFLEKDFLSGFFAILFGFGMLLSTGTSKGLYPAGVFAFIGVFGLIVSVTAFLKKPNNWIEKISLKEIVLIAFLFITPFFAKTIGFYTAGFFEIVAISLLISPKHSKKNTLSILVFSLVVTIVTYGIFTMGLNIRCPRGVLLF